jgi:hypothetical protein
MNTPIARATLYFAVRVEGWATQNDPRAANYYEALEVENDAGDLRDFARRWARTWGAAL